MVSIQGRPSRHHLEASQLVARLLERNGPTTRQDLLFAFLNIPIGCRFSVEDLKRAENLLIRVQVVSEYDGALVPAPGLEVFCSMPLDDVAELVLLELIVNEAPLWLRAGMLSDGRFAHEAVPDEALRWIDSLVDDHERRDALLLEAGQKVDDERRSEIGLMGELAVITEIEQQYSRCGRPDLLSSIRHVSQVSDALGYDVACSTLDSTRVRRLEVKTSTSSVRIRIFLTRNEFDRGLTDPDWRLVICLLDDAGAGVVGWTRPMTIAPRAPQDSVSVGCRWESASFILDVTELASGLPLD